jgi:hypothetical protein
MAMSARTRAGPWRRTLATVAVLALLVPAAALANWVPGGAGSAASRATSLGTVAQPTASVANRSVTVNWSAPAGGAPPGGYLVKRYDTGGSAQTIGAACAGTITTTSCTEAAVPAGSWRYRVTAASGNWRGTESVASATVSVAAPALALSASSVPSLPATLGGQITAFADGQTVSFRLDDANSGTLLLGSITPSPVPASGTATVSVTLPAGTAIGAHTIFAVGSAGDVASALVTVLTPQTLTTTAWDLRDASAGGAEANASDPFAFASDGRTVTTTAAPLNFTATRYLQVNQNAALPSNATPTSASFDFRYAAPGVLNSACFYFDVRRASTNAVLATHGSSASPIACSSSTSQQTFSTALPEVTSAAIANDLRVRVYIRDSLLGSTSVDQATVSVNTSLGSYTLYDQSVTDAVNGGTTDRTWPLAASGGTVYTSASGWATAFSATRYLKLTFPTYVPSGSTITGTSFVHRFRRVGTGTVCWYFEVLQGSTVIGTHGSAAAPISCSSGAAYTADTVSLPEINTPARANGAVLKLYLRSSSSQGSEHDQATLTVNYSN